MDDDAVKRPPSMAERIGAKAARKLDAKYHPARPWLGLGMMGMIGWSVAVPTLLGIALGVWLDTYHAGIHRWTLALLVAGLVLGCVNAWYWVAKEDRAMQRGGPRA
jgi:ATP synthase protein I